MSEPNYWLVGFMCLVIVVCYTLGFMMGIIFEKAREKEKQESNRIRQQAVFDNNKNSGRGQQFGSNTSGGKWYFYNPATLSFGFSEFQKKWGKRKLEDDWSTPVMCMK